MRHRMAGKRLGRTTSHRIAMRRNMAAALFQHGAIRTTEAKAKELRRFVERLITIAREGTLHARRRVIALLGHDRAMYDEKEELTDQTVVQKLFDDIAPLYQDRPGGYTRIIHLAERRIGDAGRQVILQLVEETPPQRGGRKGSSRRRQRAAKRYEAASSRGRASAGQAAAEPTEEAQEAGQAAEEQPPVEPAAGAVDEGSEAAVDEAAGQAPVESADEAGGGDAEAPDAPGDEKND